VKLPQYTFAEVNTRHITKKDTQSLDYDSGFRGDAILTVYPYDSGYFVATSIAGDEAAMRSLEDGGAYSPEFLALLRMANAQGCWYLRIDADADVIDCLKEFYW
jgi:hypothetical protein